MNTTAVGRRAEAKAREFLEAKGWKFVAANVRTRFYEIDLIYYDASVAVIVEVKYRRDALFGGGEAALDYRKAQRLIAATESWLIENSKRDQPVRIDLVVVSGQTLACRWYQNAIEVMT